MRERPLPTKKPGDTLSASHVNALSRAAEMVAGIGGSGVGGPILHSGSSIQFAGQSRFQEFLFIVTSQYKDSSDTYDSGYYLGYIRWYSHEDEEWKSDTDQSYILDATDQQLVFYVDDHVVCYWDAQREMFVPVYSYHRPLVDMTGRLTTVPSSGVGISDITFALEGSVSGTGGWGVVNDRDYKINGNIESKPGYPAHASGCGIYTFALNGTAYLRVTCYTDIDDADVSVYGCALRVEAKDQRGIGYAIGEALTPSGVVTNWSPQAEINNRWKNLGLPQFSLSGSNLKIEVPTNDSGNPEIWTFEAEVAIVFEIAEHESSSSTSSISTSSISTSSVSSTSSASSTSSISSISTSSASSTGSTSSISAGSSSGLGLDCLGACIAGTTPARMQVTLAGITSDPFGPDCCGPYNGTFALNQLPGDTCDYVYDFPVSPCGVASRLWAKINAGGGSLEVQLLIDSGAGLAMRAFWVKSVAMPFDCTTVDDDLPLFANWDFYCVYGASTCHLKAL